MARKKAKISPLPSKKGKKMAVEKTLGQFAKDKLGAKTGGKTKSAMPALGSAKKKSAKPSSESASAPSKTPSMPKSSGARKKLKDVTF